MKITTTEKSIAAAIIIGSLLILFLCFYSCNKRIEKEGGIRAVIVNIGKEIKSIGKEINNE